MFLNECFHSVFDFSENNLIIYPTQIMAMTFLLHLQFDLKPCLFIFSFFSIVIDIGTVYILDGSKGCLESLEMIGFC